MVKQREADLTTGSLWIKMIIYALPLIASNVLQLLFNAADVTVVGRFVGEEATAAVGSTGSLVSLVTGLFIGLSTSANIMVARYAGMGAKEETRKTVGMSVFVSVLFGVVLAVIGFFGARTFLTWMDCDEEVIDMATKYLKIYFLGMPVVMLYNYCSSVLRAVGDTLRPFVFLVIGGIVNVVLNLVSVIVFHMDVDGVAIATVTSQAISALLCMIVLKRSVGFSRFEWKYCRIYKKEFAEMLRIGVPSGIQGCLFSISNVIIQTTINGFGKTVMAANTVGSQLDGFVYNAQNGVAISALAFVGQNLGAGNEKRVKKSVWTAAGLVSAVGIVVGVFVVLFRLPLCGIISKDKEVIELAAARMVIIGLPYFLCGLMEVFANSLRGLGKSTLAMIVSLLCSCLFRVVYIKTIFALHPTLMTLYWVYPVSWLLTAAVQCVCCVFALKKVGKSARIEKEDEKSGEFEENAIEN